MKRPARGLNTDSQVNRFPVIDTKVSGWIEIEMSILIGFEDRLDRKKVICVM